MSQVEPDRTKYKIRNLGPGGGTLFFDSRDCWERYRKEQEKRERAGQAAIGGAESGKSPVEPEGAPAKKR